MILYNECLEILSSFDQDASEKDPQNFSDPLDYPVLPASEPLNDSVCDA
jgi:hypothetical protein